MKRRSIGPVGAVLALVMVSATVAACSAPSKLSESQPTILAWAVARQAAFASGTDYLTSSAAWVVAKAPRVKTWLTQVGNPDPFTLPCSVTCLVVRLTGRRYAGQVRPGSALYVIGADTPSGRPPNPFRGNTFTLGRTASMGLLGRLSHGTLTGASRPHPGLTPDLLGLEETQANWLWLRLGLGPRVTTKYVWNRSVPYGTVLAESPSPGTKLAGHTLRLTLSFPLRPHAPPKTKPPKTKPAVVPSPVTLPVTCRTIPPSRLSLTSVTSRFAFLMPAATAPPSDPWAGSQGADAVPNDWESYILPTPVVDATHGLVSPCEAKVWGYSLLKMMWLTNWASEYGAPVLEESTAEPQAAAFYGGPPAVTVLQKGSIQLVQGGVWPIKVTLVPLTFTASTDLNAGAAYAFISSYATSSETVITRTRGGSETSQTSSGDRSQIISGWYNPEYKPALHPSQWQFGPVWDITGFATCRSMGKISESTCAKAGVQDRS